MTDENVGDVEKLLVELKEHNPLLKSKTFLVDELIKGKTENEMLQKISDKIDNLENKISHIFGGHTLIDGKMVKMR